MIKLLCRLSNRLFIIVLFFTVSIPFSSLAQTSIDTIRVDLGEIEIKATHATLSASSAPFALDLESFSTDQLNRISPVTLDEITYRLPGIWINDRENFALGERITVRGVGWRAAFGVRGTQIILDGIPLTVADGQSVLNVIDPVFIKRIELIRGPASTFWGNSSGGVLYLSTKRARENTPTIRFKSSAGSYGLKKFDIEYAHHNERHSFNSYASYLDQNGYRDHSEAQVSRVGIAGTIRFNEKQRLQYFGAFADMPFAEHPSSLTREQAETNPEQANQSFRSIGAGKEVLQAQVGLSYEHETAGGYLKATGYGIIRDLDNPLPFAIIDLYRNAGGLRITYEKRFGSNFDLNLGIETKIQNDDREEFANIDGERGPRDVNQVENVFNNAIFATAGYDLNKFKLVGGLRADLLTFSTDAETGSFNGNRTFEAVSPSLGIHYTNGGKEYYINASTGFESPTTTELVNRPGGGNGFNPDLSQETTISLEAGSRGILSNINIHYDLALFRYWVDDLIFPFQLESDGPIFFRNQGEIRHWGGELSLQYVPAGKIALGVIYNLTSAEFENAQNLDGDVLNGNNLPGIPNHRLNGFIEWQTAPIWMTVDFEFVDQYPVNNENTAVNDSYFVLGTRFSHPGFTLSDQAKLVPFISLNNILNTQYNGSVVINAFGGRYYEPAADFNWRAGFTVQIN